MSLSEIDRERLRVEFGRLVDRLNSMPLARAESVTSSVYEVANQLLLRTRQIAPDVPADAELPRLGPHALGALIAVLGRDYMAAASTTPSTTDVTSVVDALVDLRRGLP